jgi:hypothetical protein
MNLYTVRSFAKAIKFGSKYVYQTVPRLLTIWLDMGENAQATTNEVFVKLNETVARAIHETPAYKVRERDRSQRKDADAPTPVVYGIPTNCVSCRSFQQRCLRTSERNDHNGATRIPQTSVVALYVGREI